MDTCILELRMDHMESCLHYIVSKLFIMCFCCIVES